jgi:hypothetical protein
MPTGLRASFFFGSLDIFMSQFAMMCSSRLVICDDVLHRDNDLFVGQKSDRRVFLYFKFGGGRLGMRLGAGTHYLRVTRRHPLYGQAPDVVRWSCMEMLFALVLT